MQHGQLLSHIDTDLVTREQLALVETPDTTRSFKPVPHIELIDTLEHVLRLNHITIRKEQFALRRDGATLFGVLLLAYQDTPDGMAALGLRTSNNRTMSIQLCAGLSVPVCLPDFRNRSIARNATATLIIRNPSHTVLFATAMANAMKSHGLSPKRMTAGWSGPMSSTSTRNSCMFLNACTPPQRSPHGVPTWAVNTWSACSVTARLDTSAGRLRRMWRWMALRLAGSRSAPQRRQAGG